MKKIKKIVIFIIAISLSLQFLNASEIIATVAGNGLTWSERIFNEDSFSAIFTCKVLDNIAIKKEREGEFEGVFYEEIVGYRIVAQVEKVFFGKVDTGIVTITHRYGIMVSDNAYLIYANHRNPQGNYFYLVDKKTTNGKRAVRELEILSELSNIINNKLTCKYVMLDANNNTLAEGFFKNGKRVKKWKHYYPDSKNIKTEYDFTNNSVTQYYENGLLKRKKIPSKIKEIYYQYSTENNNCLALKEIIVEKDYGQLVHLFWYYDNGKLQKQYFVKTLRVGRYGYNSDGMLMDYREYYENGKIKAKGEFFNNDSVRTWHFYDNKGKFKEEKIYKNVDTLGLITKEKESIAINTFWQQQQRLPTSSLYGKITDKKTGKPINGTIYLFRDGWDAYTTFGSVYLDSIYDIYYIKNIPIGIYEVKVNVGNDYGIVKEEVEIKENEDRELNFQLQQLPTSSLYGKITDKKTGNLIDGAYIKIGLFRDGYWYSFGNVSPDGFYSPNGIYHIKEMPIGTYEIGVRRRNCCNAAIVKEVKIKENEDMELDFQLD